MDNIFKDIRNTTFDYSKKIESSKYTQCINQNLDNDDTVSKHISRIMEELSNSEV